MKEIFVGPLVHCSSSDKSVKYVSKAIVVIQNGKIKNIIHEECGNDSFISSILTKSSWLDNEADVVHYLTDDQILIPGFIDCHVHAPQYPHVGLGSDLPLLEWLNTYIFDLEKKYQDQAFAENVYNKVVDRMLSYGSTTASYFGTIHTDSCLILADIIEKKGQRAFVGKVNMENYCPKDYCEEESKSVEETVRFIETMNKKLYSLVKPIITPRFAVCCSERLMKKLGDLAKSYNIPIQTHISENLKEIDVVRNKFLSTYTSVYQKAGLLKENTIFAHGVHLQNIELEMIKKAGSSIIHCPSSNFFLHSGVCNTANIVKHGINVGLGTDMGAGYSPSILGEMRKAVDASSSLLSCTKDKSLCDLKPINYEDAFYFGTLGGAKALHLESQIGNFEINKSFDALIINLKSTGSQIDFLEGLTLKEKFQKFFFCGDERNIEKVYVNGKLVVDKENPSHQINQTNGVKVEVEDSD